MKTLDEFIDELESGYFTFRSSKNIADTSICDIHIDPLSSISNSGHHRKSVSAYVFKQCAKIIKQFIILIDDIVEGENSDHVALSYYKLYQNIDKIINGEEEKEV